MNEQRDTIIISGFPGCGKSYVCDHGWHDYKILDSDSSKFSWIYENGIKTRNRNPMFSFDYIDHIKRNIGKVDIIFVSSHLHIRRLLSKKGIKYITVYPDVDDKETWVGRMYMRGNDPEFINNQIEHWEERVGNISSETFGLELFRLNHNEYMMDFLNRIGEDKLKEYANKGEYHNE